MNWNNELTEMLGIAYPVVVAPMLGISTPEMVAAAANAGGLGALPIGGLAPEKVRELIRKTRSLTDKPFLVNFFAHDMPAIDKEQVEQMQQLLEKLCAGNDIPYTRMDMDSLHFYSYKDQVQVLLEEGITMLSFTFGIPDDVTIRQFKEKGILLMGSATSVKEAVLLNEKGVDCIVAQGIEAGGHRGSFIEDEPLPQVGVMSLVPQIMSRVNRPVIAAGGIGNGRTIMAAFALGAQGVQIGTAFIASPESNAIPAYKEALLQAADTDTELTRTFSGRWARGIRNIFMAKVDGSGLSIPPYPIQNSLTGALRAAAQKLNNKDFTNLWAGQSAGMARAEPVSDIFRRLIQQVEALK